MAHTYTTQKELRAAFWQAHPHADKSKIVNHAGTGMMYRADTRTAWCDFLDHCARDGAISEALAQRATLQPCKAVYSFDLTADYGYGDGRETLCSEETRKEARARLKEYRENAPGPDYRIVRRRELIAQD